MTALWDDVLELPETLARTLDAADGFAETASLLAGSGVRRVVASGNGAAYYAAQALWHAALESNRGPEVVSVPAGLLARGAFRWRVGDLLLAFSSSGELRDLVEAVDAGAPTPFAAVTSTPSSTLGRRAGARALVNVEHQRAVTHTQAFCGNVAAALAVWAEVTEDAALRAELAALPATLARLLPEGEATAEGLDPELAGTPAAVAFGTGPAWAAALEAALLLKEIAGLPAEGVETREGATSAMFGLAPGHLVLSLATRDDPLLSEAEQACAARAAAVVRLDAGTAADARLAAVTTFPAAVAIAQRIGLERRLDVDDPEWTDAYYRVARG
jgi:glucosamine--fructose-6-phosphate aminotransferase (isomerizing)